MMAVQRRLGGLAPATPANRTTYRRTPGFGHRDRGAQGKTETRCADGHLFSARSPDDVAHRTYEFGSMLMWAVVANRVLYVGSADGNVYAVR